MHTVQVDTPGGHYPIHIGSGRLDALADSIPADATALALVTSTTVAGLYGARVQAALATTGKPVLCIELPDGERHKTWDTLNRIFDALLAGGLDRKAVLVALGGGVVGDICGFADLRFSCPPASAPASAAHPDRGPARDSRSPAPGPGCDRHWHDPDRRPGPTVRLP